MIKLLISYVFIAQLWSAEPQYTTCDEDNEISLEVEEEDTNREEKREAILNMIVKLANVTKEYFDHNNTDYRRIEKDVINPLFDTLITAVREMDLQ